MTHITDKGRERIRTERPGGDGEEGVRRDAGDDEARADGDGSLGQRVGSQCGEPARRVASGDGLLLRSPGRREAYEPCSFPSASPGMT